MTLEILKRIGRAIAWAAVAFLLGPFVLLMVLTGGEADQLKDFSPEDIRFLWTVFGTVSSLVAFGCGLAYDPDHE